MILFNPKPGFGKKTSTLFVAMLALFVVGGSVLWQVAPAQAVFTPAGSLKLHYAFDETVIGTAPVDTSGNNHTGTLGGSTNPTPSAQVPTTDFSNSRSLYFNGSNYVKGPGYKALDANGDLTLSAWIKTSDFANRQTIFSATQFGGYNLEINGSNAAADFDCNPNMLCGHISTDGSGGGANYGTVQYSLNNLTKNKWTHVAMTYLVSQGTKNLILYIDGQKVQTSNVTGALSPPADNVPLCIGAEATATSCSGNYYTGRIDDARVYSRVLSAGEIAEVADGKNATATWNGSSSSNFNNSTNWTPMGVPDASSKIIIPSSTSTPNSPKLARDTGIASLTLATNAKFYTNGYNLTFDAAGGETFSNDGTLYLNGDETLRNFTNDTDSGVIAYVGSDNYSGLPTGDEYYNLYFNETGETTLTSALTVHNSLLVEPSHKLSIGDYDTTVGWILQNNGQFNAGSAIIQVAGNWINSGQFNAGSSTIKVAGNWSGGNGTFNHGTSTVNLNGSSQTVMGDNAFYNLTKSITSADTLKFEASKTQTVTNNLALNGTSGNLLSLNSTTPGTQWKINPEATTSLSYLSVSDSLNGSNNFLKPTNSILGDSPDSNTNWDIITPVISNLGGSNYLNGSWGTDTTPELTFKIADGDDDAQVKYQIQIDNSSDFSSPVVDYTSAMELPDDFDFTVGQAASSGSYTTGNSSQTMADGQYYWRIKAVDNGELDSDWTTINSGSIAFGIDTVDPNTPTASPKGGSYKNNQTVTLSASDNTNGSGINAIYYTTDGSTPSAANGTEITNGDTISVSSNETIKFIAYDKSGNPSSVATEKYIIDSVAPSKPTASPAGGKYNKTQQVTLSATDNTNGSGINAIYYTTDGTTTPSKTSGTKFNSGDVIKISSNKTIKAITYDNAGNSSGVMIEEYTIDTTAPNIPVADPKGGLYTSAQSVKLSTSDNTNGSGVASVHYTLDGSTPTSSSTKYTGQFDVNTSKTIKAIAYDNAGNSSGVTIEKYIIDITAPTISSLKPADNATSASTSGHLVVKFSEPVIIKTGNITIYKAADDSIVETIDIASTLVSGSGTSTISINLLTDLKNSASYYVLIDTTALQDVAGNAFVGITSQTTWNFTTAKKPVSPPNKKPHDKDKNKNGSGGGNDGGSGGYGGGSNKDRGGDDGDGDSNDDSRNKDKDRGDSGENHDEDTEYGNGQNPHDKDQAKNLIQDYATSDGDSAAPTVQDYINAGITGVNSSNIGAVNQALAKSSLTGVASFADIQSLVAKTASSQNTSSFLGLGWWWLPVLAVVAIPASLIIARAKSPGNHE